MAAFHGHTEVMVLLIEKYGVKPTETTDVSLLMHLADNNVKLSINFFRMDKNQFIALLAVESEMFYNFLLKITES